MESEAIDWLFIETTAAEMILYFKIDSKSNE